LPFGPRNLDDLDAAGNRLGAANLITQARIGQAEHRAQLRVGIGVGRLALELKTDSAIKRNRLLEIRDDGTEIVSGADNQARRRLSLREPGEKKQN